MKKDNIESKCPQFTFINNTEFSNIWNEFVIFPIHSSNENKLEFTLSYSINAVEKKVFGEITVLDFEKKRVTSFT